jgi:iron-sulfur cluster repair protein YtfE (RIC family)
MERAYDNLKYAEKKGDPKLIEEKQNIIEKVEKYCSNEFGVFFKFNEKEELKYHIKKRLKKESDIVRSKIRMNIKKAINDLESNHKPLAEHLDRFIDTGSKCTYRPPDGVDWHIDWKP